MHSASIAIRSRRHGSVIGRRRGRRDPVARGLAGLRLLDRHFVSSLPQARDGRPGRMRLPAQLDADRLDVRAGLRGQHADELAFLVVRDLAAPRPGCFDVDVDVVVTSIS
jgi:hypothetical protein